MSVQVENLEKSMAKLTIEVSAEQFEAAMQKAYIKNKGRIQLPGFRKGKAPRAMIEKMYGAGIFYEDAANEIIPEAYEEAAKESGLVITSQPEIDVTQIEKGKSFIFTATVAVKPEVTLGEYKGLEYEAQPVEVTDEEVEEELKKVQNQQARTVTVEDRPVADGDIVTIDYEGFVDGTAFAGGKGTDYDLTIGSSGEKVRQLQQQLNRIARNYPAIPTLVPDGIYGPNTAEAVRMFQKIFHLPQTGIVDYPTWFEISDIYVGVTRISEPDV